MLSIGMFTNFINPSVGGHARNTYFLTKALERKGCKVTIFCLDDPLNKDADVDKVFVGKEGMGIIRYSLAARSVAKKMENEIDIFHGSDLYGFAYGWGGKSKPYIVHLRGNRFWMVKRMLDGASLVRPTVMAWEIARVFPEWWFITWVTTRRADFVLGNSLETITVSQRHYKIPSHKTGVVHNGCDIVIYRPERVQEIKDKYGLNQCRVLLCACRLSYGKGLNTLIEAMELILAQRRDIKLLLVGGGVLEQKMRQIVLANRLDENVIMTGTIPNHEMLDFYAACDLFVYPAAPGTTLTEAMAAGKPFVLRCPSGIGDSGAPLSKIQKRGIGHILEGGTAGAFAARILEVMDNQDWLSTEGSKARQFVEQELNWDKIAERAIGYYRQVIDSQR